MAGKKSKYTRCMSSELKKGGMKGESKAVRIKIFKQAAKKCSNK